MAQRRDQFGVEGILRHGPAGFGQRLDDAGFQIGSEQRARRNVGKGEHGCGIRAKGARL